MTFFKAALSDIRQRILARNPCVCVTTAFILGILFHRFAPCTASSLVWMATLVISACVCIASAQVFKKIHIHVLVFYFCIAGYVCSALHQQRYTLIPQSDIVVGKIISNNEEKAKTYKVLIETLEESSCKSVVYIQKDSLSQSLRYGDVISLKNTFRPIENKDSSTFDYKAFLANQYIHSQAYVRSGQWERIGHQNSLPSVCMKLRGNALETLKKLGLDEKNHQLIAALTFGDKSLLDDDTKKEFQTAGAMHILAVSGLHVGIINGLLLFMFGFIRNRNFLWLKLLCCILGIWAYACITGMSPSVQRASIMCTMVSISLLLKRHCSTYNTLAAAAFFSLFLSPNDLFSIGFQLSYAAVLSIVYFGTLIQNLFHPETPIGSYLWGIIAVSVAVQIGTMPLTLYYFGTVPTYSLLTNIVVIPLSFVVLTLTIVVLATSWIPLVSSTLVSILNFSTTYLQDAIHDINSFPHPQIILQCSFKQSICLYFLIFCLVIIIETLQKRREQFELISI
ncbi:MAG: ComEC/Rec2 family competence protein [Bacteroidales bacterium]|nr:ComEC/Rec2 family competence protein [Bacteroidales bacterium]